MHNTRLKPISTKKSLHSPPSLTSTYKAVSHKKSPIIQTHKKEIEKFKKGSIVKKEITRPATAIQLYECDDFDQPVLEEDNYFENQLEKSIKTEIMSKIQKPQSKNQIVLPKLESDMRMKPIKDLEKQMDLEMSRIMDEDLHEEK